jgi:hypothetical protein
MTTIDLSHLSISTMAQMDNLTWDEMGHELVARLALKDTAGAPSKKARNAARYLSENSDKFSPVVLLAAGEIAQAAIATEDNSSKSKTARKSAARKATTTTVPGTEAWKAEAKKAYDAAFAAAPEGQKQRAGRAAYGAIKYATV